MNILGIETSCDDTAAAIVADGRQILANITASQQQFHEKYSGVVPEIASRKHLELLLPVINDALVRAGLSLRELTAIAVSSHPGLIGSLLIGVNTAKALSWHLNLPLISINHLSAHLYALNLCHNITYPFIGLIVSGGHTLLVKAESPVSVKILGSTIDDACGEAFDKVAKYYNLGFPGGPVIDKLAADGNENSIAYPMVMLKENNYNFSFSGLKTAVIYQTEKISGCKPELKDLCASFQKAAFLPLYKKCRQA
ncbi:MAG TPA: tRNA (adenosine(37)-N6)-threonylcarbamoyltransferase complex transferase subunit TsaD, partial [Spirochaetota bacterium]|nr:tRNA (adenosine(37)-N6)-threonylcarbamoyltransferase complex transferase subunit TsaD [Spirochaetota bacterium]